MARSQSLPHNKHFCKLSYFVSFLLIVGSNNTAIDSSATGFPSAKVFPTNTQASTLFALSALNIRPWNIESLESTNNSPLALEQGVARAKVQMNRRMRERQQRELEREELQTDQDRREREIRMRRSRDMIERERKEEEVLVDGENGKRQKNNAIRGGIY